ncbi:MAG: MFS transporter [Betaproteobacteria bacterium]|nr:MFS transporter [Betaproteobacteria bacterium]
MKGILLPVLVTLAIQVLASMAVFTPPVLAPVAAQEIGVDPAAVGVATSLVYAASVFAALLSGGFINRLGPMRVSQVALVLIALGIGTMATGHVATALLGVVLIGLGYGAVTPASSVILNARTPDRWRALVFSLKQTGVPIGGVLAGALVPVMLAANGWRSAAIGVAAGCAVLAVLVQRGREKIDAGRRLDAPLWTVRLREPLRLVWRDRVLRDLALGSFAYSGMQMCLGTYLVVYLHELAGVNLAVAGAALSIAMAGGVIGRIFWGVVADRWVAPRVLLGLLGIGMSVCAFSMGVVDAAWSWFAVAGMAFVFGGMAVGWNGVYISEATRSAPKGQEAEVTGASFALTYLGVFFSPLVIWAMVASGLGYAVGFAFVGLLTLWRGAILVLRR